MGCCYCHLSVQIAILKMIILHPHSSGRKLAKPRIPRILDSVRVPVNTIPLKTEQVWVQAKNICNFRPLNVCSQYTFEVFLDYSIFGVFILKWQTTDRQIDNMKLYSEADLTLQKNPDSDPVFHHLYWKIIKIQKR